MLAILRRLLLLLLLCPFIACPSASAHQDHIDLSQLPAPQKEAWRKQVLDEWHQRQAKTGTLPVQLAANSATAPSKANAPTQAAAFQPFMPRVKLRWDEQWLHVESNGLPDHPMMTGITNWQQQVPLPHDYHGANAWRIPLHPVPAKTPLPVRDRFLRGAIAVAVNGIPIFNPQNNRGEISAEIGELDQWGGHCGRADDYHYHAAPLHLQALAGKGGPIAFALDGYAILGLTEADGAPPVNLDAFNGHQHGALDYHYHASEKMPYVNGGFHGEVTERDGQVDPQPRAQPVREALPPLRGAGITGFTRPAADRYQLTYEVDGKGENTVSYSVRPDGSVDFEFQNPSGDKRQETYTRRPTDRGKKRPPRRP